MRVKVRPHFDGVLHRTHGSFHGPRSPAFRISRESPRSSITNDRARAPSRSRIVEFRKPTNGRKPSGRPPRQRPDVDCLLVAAICSIGWPRIDVRSALDGVLDGRDGLLQDGNFRLFVFHEFHLLSVVGVSQLRKPPALPYSPARFAHTLLSAR
jgi:hypothetical protein